MSGKVGRSIEDLFIKLSKLDEDGDTDLTVSPPVVEYADWTVSGAAGAIGRGISLEDALEDAIAKIERPAPRAPTRRRNPK